MLERTAAGLESCRFQRVLSKPRRSAKRCRHLHMGFWQHGASAIELINTWPISVKTAEEGLPNSTSSRPLQTSLIASAFLLDFLYPNATYTLLRRLYPSLPRTQDTKPPTGPAPRRYFTSTSVVMDQSYRSHVERTAGSPPQLSPDDETNAVEHGTKQDNNADAMLSLDDAQIAQESVTEVESAARKTELLDLHPNASEGYKALVDILSRSDERYYHDVWDLYRVLEGDERASAMRPTVVYLSNSRSIVESNRAVSIFRQIPIEKCDDELLAAGILVLIRSGDLEIAIAKFKAGAEFHGLSGGLEYLLAETTSHRKWPLALGVWMSYFTSPGTRNSDADIDLLRLEKLANVPNLTRHYFALERHVAVEGRRSTHAMNLYSTSRQGLRSFRRKIAAMALEQACAPKYAIAILGMWKEKRLYEEYLLRMLDRWQCNKEKRSSLALLSDIYSDYRELLESNPSIALLRGMFNLSFPKNKADLQLIYRDWHHVHGDLDQWGFEKYLKYYAREGDVQTVRDLWQRYVTAYPRVLRSSRAFRSTMNVYAQMGDAAQAEKELQAIRTQYSIEPDLDIWNTLLKCYVRTGNYEQVLSCFSEIRKMHKPDAFTYAHVMTMCAKKGNLEDTLRFFAEAQKHGVQVSKEIALSLVMAYCKNDRLAQAERMCLELAGRKATSTVVWNQLIYYYGIQGNLNKCYELLQTMKKHNVEWDHQTHEFLLQALVTVKQVQAAYTMLQSAREDGLFPVGAEHFAVVMSGAVRTGELGLVETMMRQMRQSGLPVTLNVLVAVVEAAFKRAPSAAQTRTLGRELVTCLRSMLKAQGKDPDRLSTGLSGDLAELKKQTQSIGRAISLLVGMRDFSTAEELVSLYTQLIPNTLGAEAFAPQIVSALMLGYFRDGQHNEVLKMWDQTRANVLANGRHPTGGIYAAHQYDLSRPMGVVIKVLRDRRDGKALLDLVEQTRAAGFKLTRANWNGAVRGLAELGHWEEAMAYCETMLMPRWRGWGVKKALGERRELQNSRLLRAERDTVLSLQVHWLKLRSLSAWSADVSAKLADIEARYPTLHFAFTRKTRGGGEAWLIRRDKSLTKSINELLKPLSYTELRRMKKALEKQLELEQTRHPRRVESNPFHMEDQTDLRSASTALGHRELVDLDAALQSRLLDAAATASHDETDQYTYP